MSDVADSGAAERLPKARTGIRGLDEITKGGLPRGRTTLLVGAAGSGKTVLGVQFLVEGAREFGEPGVLLTFEESTAKVSANVARWASKDTSELVRAEHVERAIEQKVLRSNLIEQRLLEMVAEGSLLLDFDGERVGQVNGLSVADLGDYVFGRPVRITASAGPGGER